MIGQSENLYRKMRMYVITVLRVRELLVQGFSRGVSSISMVFDQSNARCTLFPPQRES